MFTIQHFLDILLLTAYDILFLDGYLDIAMIPSVILNESLSHLNAIAFTAYV